MPAFLLPIAFALFVWWFTTGAIIFLDNLPQRTFRWSMLGITLCAGFAFNRLPSVGGDVSVHGAYAGFVCAIVIWGWQEMSFLMGVVTGPRRQECEPDCGGFRHFIHGVQVVIYHELAILAGAVGIAFLNWGAANQVAFLTYAILWGMRVSAKLCLFLGVRNVSERFLPPHLAYLGGFFHRRPMNALLPVSVSVGSVLAVILIQRAGDPRATPFEAISAIFLGTMMVLGVIEHWFLVIPVPFEAIWDWYLRARLKQVEPSAALQPLPDLQPLPACCPISSLSPPRPVPLQVLPVSKFKPSPASH